MMGLDDAVFSSILIPVAGPAQHVTLNTPSHGTLQEGSIIALLMLAPAIRRDAQKVLRHPQ
jgi:hypothetical protein